MINTLKEIGIILTVHRKGFVPTLLSLDNGDYHNQPLWYGQHL